MSIGFALVILLLAAASYLVFQRSQAIEESARTLVKGHMTTARLVDEVESEQQKAGQLLLYLARHRGQDLAAVEDLAGQIDGSEKRIDEAVRTAQRTSTSNPAWRELGRVASSLASDTRDYLRNAESTEKDLDKLFKWHDRFLHLVGQLVREDAARSMDMEERIGQQSKFLLSGSLWLLGITVLLSLGCAGLTIYITQQSFHQIEWQAAELSRVSWHMLEGQEATARRFSHELHDELGQALTGLKAMLLGIRNEEFGERRAECVHMIDEAIGNVRELSQLLRPVILDDFGLDASIRWLADRFSQRTRIDVEYESQFSGRVTDDVETHLFRIAQEALTNVARHSGATRARIRLAKEGGTLRLVIEDNGQGIQKPAPGPSLGMVGMRARARQIGGEMTVSRGSLGGVQIEAWAPAAQAEENESKPQDAYLVS